MSKRSRGSKKTDIKSSETENTRIESKNVSTGGSKNASTGGSKGGGTGGIKNASKGVSQGVNKGGNQTESKGGSKGGKSVSRSGNKSVSQGKDKNAGALSEEIKLERQTNKTPLVMKLLEVDKNASNPVILAGKSRIPRQLSGRAPLSKLLKRDKGEEFTDIEGTVVVNITQMSIEFLAPDILDRFNACSCDKCVEEFSRIIAERVPVRFARISKASQQRGSRELTERMEPVRKIVLSEMIRELIGNKKRCFHDE